MKTTKMILVAFAATAVMSSVVHAGRESKAFEASNLLNPPINMAFAGEWTKCIAHSGGRQFNIVNGHGSVQGCLNLAIRCTGDQNVVARYYHNPVIIRAPYQRCTAF